MNPADEVASLVEELRPLIAQLQRLLPEPTADPTRGSTQHHKVTGSPAPWHPEAAAALFTVHAGARDLEADLRYRVTGHTGPARGGSADNTLHALTAIAKLVHGLPDNVVRGAAHTIAGWITTAQQVRDIGLAERWEPLHVPRGEQPPTCPYCSTYSIRVAQRSGGVTCINPSCEDSRGNRPSGRIDRSMTGNAAIFWDDGRVIYYHDTNQAEAS